MFLNVPVARDGTFFGPHLRQGGHYVVGDKYDEKKFTDFGEALSYLRDRPTARWRRPNSKGNRGIVTAVDWVSREISAD